MKLTDYIGKFLKCEAGSNVAYFAKIEGYRREKDDFLVFLFKENRGDEHNIGSEYSFSYKPIRTSDLELMNWTEITKEEFNTLFGEFNRLVTEHYNSDILCPF